MKFITRLSNLAIILFCSFMVKANDTLSTILPYEDFMTQVQAHHPLAKAANIQLEKGDAAVLQAKGSLDPKLFTTLDQKYFDDKSYYSQLDAGMSIPTILGIEFKGGRTQTDGLFLNPENSMPDAGLWYVGVNIPLLQGLITNERRLAVTQAKIFKESTVAKQQQMINELLFNAGQAYWQWFKSFHALSVYQEAVELAEERFIATKTNVRLGDKPAIDTVEAGIQVQNRQVLLQESLLDYINAVQMVNVFLWQDGIQQLGLAQNAIPLDLDNGANITLPTNLQNASYWAINHPSMVQYAFKMESLDVERKFKRDQLKPSLNVSYNALTNAALGESLQSYSINNYKWGLSFQMPLLFRKARGGLALTKIKLQETEWEMNQKQAMLNYKIQEAENQLNTMITQASIYRNTVADYQRLYDAEVRLFNNGESSLFMINSREQGYVKSQVDWIGYVSKAQLAKLKTAYTKGILMEE